MEQPHDYDERKPLRVTSNTPKLLLSSTVTSSQPLLVLPDELLTEVLTRLPARLLLRLRSVCRSWRTLISSSQFANYHIQRSIAADPSLSGPRVAFHHSFEFNCITFGDFSLQSLVENPSEPTEVVLFEERPRCHEINSSCNGLLCMHGGAHSLNNSVMLWNPYTGLTSQSLKIRGFIWNSGFGYDHVNDKYKLVAVVKQMRERKPQTRIYTFCGNPSMRTIQDMPCGVVGDETGVFVPGTATLNWVCQHMEYLVISLDLVKETFSEFSLSLKDPDNKTFDFPQLCVLRNCLAACVSHDEKTHWSVWLMEEYGVPQSWTKFASISCHPSLSGHHLRPLYIWENYVLMAAAAYSKIVLYNLDHDGFEFPVLEHTPPSNKLGLYFCIYHESLVSPPYRSLPSTSSQIQLIKP